jgi:hypothetical protein
MKDLILSPIFTIVDHMGTPDSPMMKIDVCSKAVEGVARLGD